MTLQTYLFASRRKAWVSAVMLLALSCLLRADSFSQSPVPQLVIFDTDIGDDIDDVFALGLALQSPELKLLGVTAAWGDTALRARMLDRFLAETHHADIPVFQGPERHKGGEAAFSQAAWAGRARVKDHGDAIEFLLKSAREHPNQITLISVAPLTNLGAAIERNPEDFRKFKRIVIMGGSVRRGYDDLGLKPYRQPSAEYNIKMDIPAAQKVFASGVPLYVMPLDSTQLKFDEVKRQALFTRSTPLTDALTLLYHQWSRETKQVTPTMFDAVAVAYAIQPDICPVTPLSLTVDASGFTREANGKPNTFVCLDSDSDRFFQFYLPRLLREPLDSGN
jgi:purine nucleosidase